MKKSGHSDFRLGRHNESMLYTWSLYIGVLGTQGLIEGGEGWRLQGIAS